MRPSQVASDNHLAGIDAQAWPGIVDIPAGLFAGAKARRAESEFAAACEDAGFVLDGHEPDLTVLHEQLFARIANAGWLGLAEGFMAEEWDSEQLVDILLKLLKVGYRPRFGRATIGGEYTGAEIPDSLVRLFSGDGMSAHGTVFSSGVPTTVRTQVKSFVSGAGRGSEPATHFVDVTDLSAPTLVERADLADAQLRTISMLLDSANVGMGTHMLDFPSSGAALPIAAAQRQATVDVLTADASRAKTIRDVLDMAEIDSSVHVELMDSILPNERTWPSNYDAITSVEKLETLGEKTQRAYVRGLDRMLAKGGYIAMQTVIRSENYSPAADRSLDVVRAYITPALHYLSAEELHRLFDVHTQLRIIEVTHVGQHYIHGLKMQRETFEGKLREAAASGFDKVYRNLWIFQLALKEALFRFGALDAVQLLIATRPQRRGR